MVKFKEIDDINHPFEVGALPKREMALSFADYLNSKGIKAVAKPGFGASYCVYIAEERHLSQAKLELLRYGNNPFARAYNSASWSRGGVAPREKRVGTGFLGAALGVYGFTLLSLVTLVELLCLAAYLLSLAGLDGALVAALSWTSLAQITQGFEAYRVLTPVFLHFGFLHIAFNLVMFEAFGRQIERHCGVWKTLYLLVSVALVSNALQFVFTQGADVFGGLSGVVYGLIGYMGVLSRRRDLPERMRLPQGLLAVSVVFIGLGFFMSGVANLCHVGGLLLGMAMGFVDLKRPLKAVCPKI